MVKKPKQATKAANIKEIKEQLEAIVGNKTDLTEQQLAKFSYPIGFWSIFGGFAVWKSIFGKTCSRQIEFDASGVSSTLADGKRVFRVSDIVCSGIFQHPLTQIGYVEPINVVATPRAERPVFLTMTSSPVPPGPQLPPAAPDVQITVFTWEANGVPAPNVEFDWRCRAVLVVGEKGPVVSPG
jgi:hypothetical protein